MAIARKPKPADSPTPPSVDVEALIAKGGSIGKETKTNIPAKGTASFTLRVPNEILAALDDHLQKQPVKVPRQQWILEALVQRLEREVLAPSATPDS